MGKVADKIASRVESMSGSAEGASSVATSEVEGSGEGAIEASAPSESVPTEGAVETIETASGGQPPTEPDELTIRKQILAEKLAASRERRAAVREERERRTFETKSKAQIESELEEVRAEKAKWEKLKVGSFKDGLKALGRDPLKTFEELEREAAEANTPEGKIARMQEEYAAKLAELNDKIATLISEKEEERKTAQDRDLISRFESDFGRQLQDPTFRALRVAYEDEELLAFAHGFRQQPERMHAAAKLHGIRLTNPRAGFTMREILTVLSAAQEAYDGKRKARESRLSGESGGPQGRHRVNGASAPEAVSTIGSELASTRASGESTKRLSRQERIDAEIDRLERSR